MQDVLLAGGAGGLGRAVAQRLAEHGIRVFSADIAGTHVQHKNVVPVEMDIRSMASVEKAFAAVKAQSGGLSAVISLAGVYVMDSMIEVSEAEFERILDINVTGVFRVNKVFMPLLAPGGRFVITTSEVDSQGQFPFNGMYAMSKTALGCYADALRLEVQLLGLQVITVRPGAFSTQMVSSTDAQLQKLVSGTKLYQMGIRNFERVMHARTGNAKDPDVLAKVYLKAVTARRPRLLYRKNASWVIRLYTLLPRRVQAFAIRAILSGGRKKKQ